MGEAGPTVPGGGGPERPASPRQRAPQSVDRGAPREGEDDRGCGEDVQSTASLREVQLHDSSVLRLLQSRTVGARQDWWVNGVVCRFSGDDQLDIV